MNSLTNSLNTLSLTSFPLLKPHLHVYHSLSLQFPTQPCHQKLTLLAARRSSPIRSSSPSVSDIDMVKNKQGVYAPRDKRVVVLWDLDNKPPRGPPYEAAVALRQVAERFGEVVEISAYANRHAFIHVPQWVAEQRRERKHIDILERKGEIKPVDLYVCSVCGRKCKTNLDLKKHFKQLHERERQKKLNRMNSLKGKKRQKFKERFISGNEKYNQAARTLLTPKTGYGLASELRRAGVFVKTVADKPQAADWAVKKQMEHSMNSGIDWIFLISDDKDFSNMLRKAREANLGTVVVGDQDRSLGRHADLWVPWNDVQNGDVLEKDLNPNSVRRVRDDDEDDDEGESDYDDGFFSISGFDEEGFVIDEDGELDRVVEELIVERTRFGGVRISSFSDDDNEEWEIEEHRTEDYLFGDEDRYF